MDTRRACCARLRRATPGGGSPSACRHVRQALEEAVVETAQTWEQDGSAHGEVCESSGGDDETCWPRMLLVFQDVLAGSLRREDVADDRPSTPGKAGVDERRKALGTAGRSVGRER